ERVQHIPSVRVRRPRYRTDWAGSPDGTTGVRPMRGCGAGHRMWRCLDSRRPRIGAEQLIERIPLSRDFHARRCFHAHAREAVRPASQAWRRRSPGRANARGGSSRTARGRSLCRRDRPLPRTRLARPNEARACWLFVRRTLWVTTQLLTLGLATKLIAFEVATKLVAHRRQEAIWKVVFSPRAELLEQCRGQDRRRGCALDSGMGRPAAFAGIRHATGKLLQVRLLGHR